MTLEQRILSAIRAAELNQTQLADRVGVSRAHVSRWVNGVQAPRYKHLVAIARACGIPLSELFADPKPRRRRATASPAR